MYRLNFWSFGSVPPSALAVEPRWAELCSNAARCKSSTSGQTRNTHSPRRHPCRGLWLGAHNLNLPANCFRTVIEGAQSRRTLGEETAFATSQITANPSFNLSFTVRSGTTRATAHTLAESFRL